jgi:predicted phosphodiesterase
VGFEALPLRVQLLSDLHFEYDDDGGEAFARSVEVAGDVLVLAGDILPLQSFATVTRAFGWFCARFPHVVYVPGNHEYYRTSPAEADALLAACGAALPNLHVLNPGLAVIDGVRFVGGTLWFPPTEDEQRYRGFLTDFSLIRDFVPWVHDTHAAQLAFLEKTVRDGDVVVSHHLPHPKSTPAMFANSPLNRFFVAGDAVDLLARGGARLWLHGHTHSPRDYVVGATRVVCNPRGYPHEKRKPAVNLGLAIEVGVGTRRADLSA